jgi:RNA polymerase sigma-70 factor (ECF subfamily)
MGTSPLVHGKQFAISPRFEMSAKGEEYDLLNQVSDDRPANNPERKLFRRELRAHVLCALQRLTARERHVLELKHFQGLKMRAVSEILHTWEESTKATLHRTTRKLRFQLTAYPAKGRSSRCGRAVKSAV